MPVSAARRVRWRAWEVRCRRYGDSLMATHVVWRAGAIVPLRHYAVWAVRARTRGSTGRGALAFSLSLSFVLLRASSVLRLFKYLPFFPFT
jgi:hypothetical protein